MFGQRAGQRVAGLALRKREQFLRPPARLGNAQRRLAQLERRFAQAEQQRAPMRKQRALRRRDEQTGLHKGRLALSPLVDERSEEHTTEHQSLLRISYAVLCLKKKKP